VIPARVEQPLRDVTPASDSAASLRWLFKLGVTGDLSLY